MSNTPGPKTLPPLILNGIFANVPITEPCLIIGLRDESEPRFLACTVKHCSSMGYGFYHVGLFPDEVVSLNQQQVEAMCHALDKYSDQEACCQTVSGATAR